MRIAQILSGLPIAITNEERKFIDKHKTEIFISSLDEHDQWLAQNLVRKGIYAISKDSRSIIKQLDESNTP